ncbi:MAG TPA: hypothetical protein VIC35_09165 [Acidimicrobiia bacterium]
MPNVLNWFGLPWLTAAGRLVWSTLLLVVLLIPVLVILRRPKADEPPTWAQSMGAAVYVFAMFLLAYAVIPSAWLTYADSYIQWDTSKYIFKSTSAIPFMTAWNWPFSFNAQALRDIVAVTIYGIFIGLNLFLFSKWQKRPTQTEAAEAKPVEVGRSRFGRPLKAKV